jgi:hypothetical protein
MCQKIPLRLVRIDLDHLLGPSENMFGPVAFAGTACQWVVVAAPRQRQGQGINAAIGSQP